MGKWSRSTLSMQRHQFVAHIDQRRHNEFGRHRFAHVQHIDEIGQTNHIRQQHQLSNEPIPVTGNIQFNFLVSLRDYFSFTFGRTRVHYIWSLTRELIAFTGISTFKSLIWNSVETMFARTPILADLRSCDAHSFVFRVDSQLIARIVRNETNNYI